MDRLLLVPDFPSHCLALEPSSCSCKSSGRKLFLLTFSLNRFVSRIVAVLSVLPLGC